MPTAQDKNPFDTNEALKLANDISSSMGQAADDQRFEILGTMRFTPIPGQEVAEDQFFLLKLHYQRFDFALRFFQWPVKLSYSALWAELRDATKDLAKTKTYKIRALISRDTESLRIEAYEVPQKVDLYAPLTLVPDIKEQYIAYLDDRPTPIGPFTSLKTTRRQHYTEARERHIKKDGVDRPQEVILFNSMGAVMEGSITNIAFNRAGRWYTPSLVSGGLCGVMRAKLIADGVVSERVITRKSVVDGEKILLFNAVQGVCMGELVIPKESAFSPGSDGDGDGYSDDDNDEEEDGDGDEEEDGDEEAAGLHTRGGFK